MSYAKRCEENDNVPAACESTAVIPSITLADGEALVLRTCRQDMTSHDDFTWPNSGPVAAPDWRKDGECGHGLHGLLWGIGDGGLLNWAEDAIWLAVKVKAAECQNLDGKVKYPAGEVVYCGKREEAVELIMRHLPDAGMKAGMVCGITGATGDRGSASATGYLGSASATGDLGSASATGDLGSASATGYRGSASATGDRGSASATGYRGSASATGDLGSASATGYRGSASATGDRGSASATGYLGSASATGDRGSASATDRGYILLGRWDDKAKRQRVVVLYPGEDGIKPNTWYRLDDSGKPMELAPLKEGWQDRVRESGESISEGTS